MISSTEPTLKKIREIFAVVNRELFTVNEKQNYENTLQIIIKLIEAVEQIDLEDNSELWSIGEYGSCDLASFIVGAFWFCSDCHNGQGSTEYSLLSSLGSIFQRGHSNGIDTESSELSAYDALIVKHNEYNKTKLELWSQDDEE